MLVFHAVDTEIIWPEAKYAGSVYFLSVESDIKATHYHHGHDGKRFELKTCQLITFYENLDTD